MSLGQWASEVAGGNETCAAILDGVPGPMCPKIDDWSQASRHYRGKSRGTRLSRESSYEDVASLYSEADQIQDERDLAIEGLEECRTALDALRGALIEACDKIKQLEAVAGEAEEAA